VHDSWFTSKGPDPHIFSALTASPTKVQKRKLIFLCVNGSTTSASRLPLIVPTVSLPSKTAPWLAAGLEAQKLVSNDALAADCNLLVLIRESDDATTNRTVVKNEDSRHCL
jgi:hypothetical protein